MGWIGNGMEEPVRLLNPDVEVTFGDGLKSYERSWRYLLAGECSFHVISKRARVS